MVSLVDIGPLTEPVTIRGHRFDCHGLSAQTIFNAMAESPALRMVMANKTVNDNMAQTLIVAAPDAVARCIAASIGEADNAEVINFARDKLSAGEQLMFVQAILKMTVPQTLKVFMDGLSALIGEQLFSGISGSPTKAADTRLQEPSPSASGTGSDTVTLG